MIRRSFLALLTIALYAGLPTLAVAQEAPATAKPKAEFVTLGTGGGPLIRLKRSQPANAVVVGDVIYLFDAGDGVQRQLAGIGASAGRVRAVFLSHHHMDHNAGLSALALNRWLLSAGRLPPLVVMGPPGTTKMAAGIATGAEAVERAPIMIGGPPLPTVASSMSAKDLAPGLDTPSVVYQDDLIRVTAVLNDHYHFPAGSVYEREARSYAFRIEAGGRVFVYSGDTGPSARLTALARNADLLVTEVMDIKQQRALLDKSPIPRDVIPSVMAHLTQNHLTPADVGRMARDAKVKKVVLTHFVPGMDFEVDARPYTEGIAALYKGEVVTANDLDRF